jgi:drug/metabolite transporter (DMT)-like permease
VKAMRSSKGLLVLSAVLAIAGVLLFAFPSEGTVWFTGQSAGPDGEDIKLPTLLYIDYRRVIGIVLMWVASLLVAGVVGGRLIGVRP